MSTLILALVPGANAQSKNGAIALVPSVRIDGNTENLSPIGQVTLSKSGLLVGISQPQDGHFLVYDSTGKKLAVIGRTGSGPGEFREFYSGGAGWIADTLWVYDQELRRTTLFRPTGKLVRTVPLPQMLVRPAAKDAPATRVIFSFIPYATGIGQTAVGRARFGIIKTSEPSVVLDQGFIVVDSLGKTLRTIATIQPDKDFIELRHPGRAMDIGIPFAPVTYEDVRMDGSVATVVTTPGPGTKGSYRVTRIRASGDTVFAKNYSFDGVPIPAAISDSIIKEKMRSPSLTRSAFAADISTFDQQIRAALPRVYPPISGIHQAVDDETTWLELRNTSNGRPCVILNAKGEVLATVMLPRGNRLEQVSRSAVWTQERDEDDVQSIRRFRIERRP